MLNEIIKYSEQLQKESLNKSILDFFKYTDELFEKELTEKTEKEKEENRKQLQIIKEEIIPNTKKLFEQTENKIRNIIEKGREDALNIIQEEMDNIDERIKDAGKDLDKATQKLQEKINIVVEKVKEGQKVEIENLMKEIEKLLDKKLYNTIGVDGTTTSTIDTNKGLTKKMVISIFTSVITGVAVRTGLVYLGGTILAGTSVGILGGITTTSSLAGAFLGPVGIAIGFGVGITISLGTALFHYFNKSGRYKKGLEEFKQDLSNKFDDSKKNSLDDYKTYKDEFFKEINIKLELLEANIEEIDEKRWEDIKNKYQIQKERIMEKINKMH